MAAEDRDHLVRSVYVAATGGACWQDTLVRMRQLLGAQALALRSRVRGAASPAPDSSFLAMDVRIGDTPADGINPEDTWPAVGLEDAAPRGDARLWPWLPAVPASRGDGSQVWYLAPTNSLGRSTMLAISWAGAGPAASAADTDWLAAFGRHLRHALDAWHRLLPQLPAAQAGQALLEGLAGAAWLLTPDGQVVAANTAAQLHGIAQRWLQRVPGRPQPAHAAARAEWVTSLAPASGLPSGQATAVAQAHAPPAAEATRPVLRRLAPIPRGAAGAAPAGALLALLPGAADLAQPDARALCAALGLTPAEARVSQCLASGLSVPEIAKALSVAPSTVRTHLRQVKAKLGRARKIDVVRLLAQGHWLWPSVPAEKQVHV